MRITNNLITRDLIKTGLDASNRDELFDEMLDFFCERFPAFDKKELLDYLNKREAKGTTNLEFGLAVPHGRPPSLDATYGAIGISRGGIDFFDNRPPVYIVTLLFASDEPGNVYLKILSSIACLLKNTAIREELLNAESPDEAFDILSRGEVSLGISDD